MKLNRHEVGEILSKAVGLIHLITELGVLMHHRLWCCYRHIADYGNQRRFTTDNGNTSYIYLPQIMVIQINFQLYH
jgi:hypothetical protein